MNTHAIRTGTLAVALLVVTGPAAADGLERDRFYLGGGIGANEIGTEDATGYQFFVGYELPFDTGEVDTAVELGFWDSGDFDAGPPGNRREVDADGVWLNGVAGFALSPRVDLFGRAGLDFGDDDGLMVGAGVGFELDRGVELRGEYVERDETESLQANLVFRF